MAVGTRVSGVFPAVDEQRNPAQGTQEKAAQSKEQERKSSSFVCHFRHNVCLAVFAGVVLWFVAPNVSIASLSFGKVKEHSLQVGLGTERGKKKK
jgi:hypothetical protein